MCGSSRHTHRRQSLSLSSEPEPSPLPLLRLLLLLLSAAATTAAGRATPVTAQAFAFAVEAVPDRADEVSPDREAAETALGRVHAVATGTVGALCVTQPALPLGAPLAAGPRFDAARRQLDLVAVTLQELGVPHHGSGLEHKLLDAMAQALLPAEGPAAAARLLALNASSGAVLAAAAWRRWREGSGGGAGGAAEAIDGAGGAAGAGAGGATAAAGVSGPTREPASLLRLGHRPDPQLPWFEDAASSPTLRSPKFQASPAGRSYKGWWTFPYWSCSARRWLLSYSVALPPAPGSTSRRDGARAFLSVDVDLSALDVNQCDALLDAPPPLTEVTAFRGTHKCHNDSTMCVARRGVGWSRGGYVCACRPGFFSLQQRPFNGTLVED